MTATRRTRTEDTLETGERRLRIVRTDLPDGYEIVRETRTFRILLDGGRTVDVTADRLDSEVLELVLKATGAKRIEGHTSMSR